MPIMEHSGRLINVFSPISYPCHGSPRQNSCILLLNIAHDICANMLLCQNIDLFCQQLYLSCRFFRKLCVWLSLIYFLQKIIAETLQKPWFMIICHLLVMIIDLLWSSCKVPLLFERFMTVCSVGSTRWHVYTRTWQENLNWARRHMIISGLPSGWRRR